MPKKEIKWRDVAHAQIPNIASAVPPVIFCTFRLLGSTEVDDDGNAVREREIRAKFPFYDIEILSN